MTILFTSAGCLEHETAPRHPERPARLASLLRHLEDTGLLVDCRFGKRRKRRRATFCEHTAADRPNLVNTPLPAGTRGGAFRKAVERDWLPALDAFRPQLILVSAGFDAHADDPLGDLLLGEDDFAWVTSLIVNAAEQHAEGRIVSVLEGGYDLPALGRSVVAHLQALA